MKRIVITGLTIVVLLSIYLMVKRSLPYENVMQTHQITLDSFTVAGPVVLIYDKPSRKNFWLKSYTSFDAKEFDSLQGKEIRIHFMKAFAGPFENRIFKMEIDSVILFDQAMEENQPPSESPIN